MASVAPMAISTQPTDIRPATSDDPDGHLRRGSVQRPVDQQPVAERVAGRGDAADHEQRGDRGHPARRGPEAVEEQDAEPAGSAGAGSRGTLEALRSAVVGADGSSSAEAGGLHLVHAGVGAAGGDQLVVRARSR